MRVRTKPVRRNAGICLTGLKLTGSLAAEPVDRLIWAIYCDPHIFALATGSDGEQDKKANLLMLYDYARKFESGS